MSFLPNFFVVGAPKAGTTSLYHYLDQHPEIYMSPVKEPNYFASELRFENFSDEYKQETERDTQALQEYLRGPMREKRFGGIVSDWEDYLKLFHNAGEAKAIGEASVCYLWSPTAPGNIFSRIPEAKIIMVLRDPAERAFSQYMQMIASGRIRQSFRDHVQDGLNRKSHKFGMLHPFLELGMYYEQVKRYLEMFPRQNVGIYFYEEAQERPGRFLADVFRFLGVDPAFSPDTSQKHLEPPVPRSIGVGYVLKKIGLWQRARALSPRFLLPALRTAVLRPRDSIRMDPSDRNYLAAYYQEDIRKLSSLLNRDLATWLH